MSNDAPLRFIDSDGHILEHPNEMLDYAPRAARDRIWHIETDAGGNEWCVFDGRRVPANGMSMAGVAGMGAEAREQAAFGQAVELGDRGGGGVGVSYRQERGGGREPQPSRSRRSRSQQQQRRGQRPSPLEVRFGQPE